MITERLTKIALIAAIAFFFSLVVLNNLTDYATNFTFVQHVLAMDTLFPDSTLTWRAIANPTIQQLFYSTIIAWEVVTATLCWIGTVHLIRAVKADALCFNRAKAYGLIGLTSSCLLWLVAFWSIGGEWFAMWQSPIWNGQPIAFRMFTITILILMLVRQPDSDLQL